MYKLAIAICLASSIAFLGQYARAQSDAVSLSVEGQGFSVATLHGGGGAYANRNYVWDNVPPRLEGWNFTKIRGGEPAEITANGPTSGYVYIAVDSTTREIDGGIPGWERVPDISFTLTDHKRTPYAVYRTRHEAGAPVTIPKFPWGGLVLAPTLTQVGGAGDVESAASAVAVVDPPGFPSRVAGPRASEFVVVRAHRRPEHRVVRHEVRHEVRRAVVVHHTTAVRREHTARVPIKAGRRP